MASIAHLHEIKRLGSEYYVTTAEPKSHVRLLNRCSKCKSPAIIYIHQALKAPQKFLDILLKYSDKCIANS